MVRRLVLAALAAALLAAAPAAAAPELVKVGDFAAPVHVAAPPGDPRLFVVEQDGLVKVVSGGSQRTFLDLSAITNVSGNERGLLSIAFPPDYPTSGLFYVYLTAPGTGTPLQVYEHRRSASDPNLADPTSRRLVISIPHPEAGNHNGGQLAFGPDGLLYIGTGDGGNSNDNPVHDAEDTGSLRGKILRIDPRGATPGVYTVPAGNPFGSPVWAYGLRNPWRFSFDRTTGDLVIGDVGQGHREEIDFAPAGGGGGRGANFGWRCYEGSVLTPQDTSASAPLDPPLCAPAERPAVKVDPVADFTHGAPDNFCSITGGFVVRDPGLPTLAGRYLYGDICRPALRSLVLGTPSASGDRAEPTLGVAIPTSFGEDACGRVYVASIPGYAHAPGAVYRIQDGAPSPCDFPTPPGIGQPGGGQPGAGQPGADSRAPQLRLGVTGRRSVVPSRRLRLLVRTDEAAAATLSGRLRGVARFRSALRDLTPASRTAVNLRLSRPAARKLRRALRRRGRVYALLTVRGTDAAGNASRVTRRIKLRP